MEKTASAICLGCKYLRTEFGYSHEEVISIIEHHIKVGGFDGITLVQIHQKLKEEYKILKQQGGRK